MTLFSNQMWQYRHISTQRKKQREINAAKTHAIVYCSLNMYE